MLNDNQIFYSLQQLKYQFNDIKILDPFPIKDDRFCLKDIPRSIYFANINLHWLLLTNINPQFDGWIIYDSLNNESYVTQLRSIFKKIKQASKISVRFIVN
ncbi:unnamed protein product [Brachionus calyciflorus]|uniref:Uncharacterized protein n=1 Tax=Brachionus calyciflorus TaxID=104777 RepID=A0A814APV4_9BILA|nr:unnamed protein product [Brachionus calyciflorus]